MNEFDPYQSIDEYLRDGLSSEELNTFNKALELDEMLKKEVNDRKKAHKVLEVHARIELAKHVAEVHEKIKRPKSSIRFKTIIKIAASVILLAIVGLLTYTNLTLSDAQLYESHYSSYDDNVTVLGGNSSVLVQAMQHYNKEDFTKAIDLFNQVLENSPDYVDGMFYRSMCYFQLNKLDQAESELRDIIDSNGKYEQTAQWYIALLYLKNNQLDKCKTELKLIANHPNAVYKKAESRELLKQLQNPLRKYLLVP